MFSKAQNAAHPEAVLFVDPDPVVEGRLLSIEERSCKESPGRLAESLGGFSPEL